jgi:hypothetical protein
MLSMDPTDPAQRVLPANLPTFAPSVELRAILLDPAWCKEILPIVTPLLHEGWSQVLDKAGLLSEYQDLPKGIHFGFRSGLKLTIPSPFIPPNACLATSNPTPIDEYLVKESSAGWISRKYTEHELLSLIGPFRTNPLSLVKKVVGSGKFHMTNNFSYPYDDMNIPSINSTIDKHDFECSWSSFSECYLIVAKAPPGTEASVFDVSGAFHNVPLAPEECPFTTMSWRGRIYLDHVYCFSMTSAPGVFG